METIWMEKEIHRTYDGEVTTQAKPYCGYNLCAEVLIWKGINAMAKNYVGCCGYCKHMDLRSGYTSAYSTSFKCTRNNYSVKADEKSCNKFEADGSRSNATIARYDK